MTPDTAAPRPRSRDLNPGDVLVWTGQPRPMDLAKVIDRRKDDDTGWWMTDSSGLADFVWDDGAAWTTVRALCDAADEVERLRANRDALREQVQRLRASRESNRGGWARTLAERDALRAAVDRVRALGERDGRDRLAAWLASNGVDQPDTVAVEAAAFVLAALESGNYGTPEWFSSIDKPLFPLEAESSCPACERDDGAHEVERLNALVYAKQSWIDGAKVDMAAMEDTLTASRTAHAALAAELRALHTGPNPHVPNGVDRGAFLLGWEDAMESAVAALDRHAPTTGATP